MMSTKKIVVAAALLMLLQWTRASYAVEAVVIGQGETQRTMTLGMKKQDIAASVGAPDIVKNDGRCWYYQASDMSVILDAAGTACQFYLGRRFSGAIKKSDGGLVKLNDVLKDFGTPRETLRRTYAPSTLTNYAATVETENRVHETPPRPEILPREYRGQQVLYELCSGDAVVKYKYVLDEDGIAFWMDGGKKLYATVLYRPATAASAVGLDRIHFDFDKSAVSDAYVPVLDRNVLRLQQDQAMSVTIEGHTDSMGSDAYNQRLSECRAESVYRYFSEQGIAASRMKKEGRGAREPKAPNATPDGRDNPEGRAINRRVEFKVHPAAP